MKNEPIGYFVCLPESKEYLYKAQVDAPVETYMWTREESRAQLFESEEEARKVAKKHGQGGVVLMVIDRGHDFFIEVCEKDR